MARYLAVQINAVDGEDSEDCGVGPECDGKGFHDVLRSLGESPAGARSSAPLPNR